jgi:hypothetical protein
MKYYLYKFSNWYLNLYEKSGVSIYYRFIYVIVTMYIVIVGGTLIIILFNFLFS